MPLYAVIRQNPLAFDKVKEGRTIYLYASTNDAPLREIPDLVGKFSQEAGIMKLKNLKFTVGEIIFKPSDTEGDILDLQIKGVSVKKGQMAPQGSIIDIVVGGGLSGTKVTIPCLIGKTLADAEFILSANELNLGLVDFGIDVLTDTANAVIYKQFPDGNGTTIRIGEPIDVFLIQELPLDVNKCAEDTLKIKN